MSRAGEGMLATDASGHKHTRAWQLLPDPSWHDPRRGHIANELSTGVDTWFVGQARH